MKKLIWCLWASIVLVMLAYWGYELWIADNKSNFLIGEATHGHHQIEMACSTCHTSALGGKEILQNACMNCHGEELVDAHDSHPKKKFTDPRNANLLKTVDARYCVACHAEHKKDFTHPMGLTLPTDVCFHCHKDVGKDRPSHVNLGFDTCASAGCHNYHDNRALYESFLADNADQPWLNAIARIGLANRAHTLEIDASVTAKVQHDEKKYPTPEHWSDTSHAKAQVSCGECHLQSGSTEWIEKPGLAQCASCHQQEAVGFTSGKHGMRLASNVQPILSPMTTAQSEMPFKSATKNVQHGCTSCHGAHEFNTQIAAVDSCLSCHDDEHSRAFENSAHGTLWKKSLTTEIPKENAVSCATCHMPRVEEIKNGTKIVSVEHNQNATLRPNEKMIRPVCMSCHGLAFSIDALADEQLIKRNFNGKPSVHIESVDWAKKRDVKSEKLQ